MEWSWHETHKKIIYYWNINFNLKKNELYIHFRNWGRKHNNHRAASENAVNEDDQNIGKFIVTLFSCSLKIYVTIEKPVEENNLPRKRTLDLYKYVLNVNSFSFII